MTGLVFPPDYGLWMAQYADKKCVNGYKENPWTDDRGIGAFNVIAIHQYTSTGRLTGYDGNLDLDIAYMTPASWDKYARQAECVRPIEYYPKYDETLVKVLDSIGINSTYAYREKIAFANGIVNYTGTDEQNLRMLNLLKAGKLIKP